MVVVTSVAEVEMTQAILATIAIASLPVVGNDYEVPSLHKHYKGKQEMAHLAQPSSPFIGICTYASLSQME